MKQEFDSAGGNNHLCSFDYLVHILSFNVMKRGFQWRGHLKVENNKLVHRKSSNHSINLYGRFESWSVVNM
jgi:hypothetical protein